MVIKNVIFDLDGTLLNTAPGLKEAILYTVNQLGYEEPNEESLFTFIGPPIQNSFINYYGSDETEAQRAADIFRAYYKDISLLKADPYEGIFDLLEELNRVGIITAVATYKREDYALKLLKAFNFDAYCKSMHGGDNFNKLTKSDIIQICMDEIGATRENTLYVGDTNGDLKGAKGVGIKFVAATYGFGFTAETVPQEKSVVGSINKPMELLTLIDSL